MIVDGVVVNRAVLTDFFAALLNPSSANRITHVWVGAATMGAFFVLSISSYWILEHIKANLSVFVQTNYINRGQTQMLLQVLAKLRPTMELEVFQLVRALNARTGEPGVLEALVQAVREEHGLNGPKL